MKALLLFAAATVALMAEAWAGDSQTPVLNVPQQNDSQEHNWSGFYMGVQGGYADGTINSNGQTDPRDTNTGVIGHTPR